MLSKNLSISNEIYTGTVPAIESGQYGVERVSSSVRSAAEHPLQRKVRCDGKQQNVFSVPTNWRRRISWKTDGVGMVWSAGRCV